MIHDQKHSIVAILELLLDKEESKVLPKLQISKGKGITECKSWAQSTQGKL